MKQARNRLNEQNRVEARKSGWQPDLQKQIQQKIFQKYEILLNKEEQGPVWLQQTEIAEIVKEAIHYRDTNEYSLYAYCIMPNHVHMIFKHLTGSGGDGETDFPISNMLMSLKRYTARESSKVLDRRGSFWQNESYDRVIRDSEELERTIAYTLNNPIKAGFVDHWEEWPHSYCKPQFLPTFSSL